MVKRQKLYVKIYLAVLASIAIFAVATALLWHTLDDREERTGGRFDAMMQLVQNAIPDASWSPEQQQMALEKLNRNLRLNIVLIDPSGAVLAQVGDGLNVLKCDHVPVRGRGGQDSEVCGVHVAGLAGEFALAADGRVAYVRPPRILGGGRPPKRDGDWPMGVAFISGLGLLLGAVALTALPLTRRLTRRLEVLNTGVARWGQGDLSVRVPVQGKDEVAKLASSFNSAAEKIEELVQTNKLLLANASHELRTPLTRIRMNVEMLKIQDDARQTQRKAEIERDINELDEMIEGILLSSRLDAYAQNTQEMPLESVDVLALVAEESAHYAGVQVAGESVTINANPKLLQRLVRNVVENALKYGAAPIDVSVVKTLPKIATSMAQGVDIHFKDHGAGVSLDDPNQLFEPFVRAHPSQKGAGLGLALVKKIAERHGGGVEIVSKKGEGLHLVVHL